MGILQLRFGAPRRDAAVKTPMAQATYARLSNFL